MILLSFGFSAGHFDGTGNARLLFFVSNMFIFGSVYNISPIDLSFIYLSPNYDYVINS